MNRKSLIGLKVTDDAAGTFECVFAKLNVIDKDGDVTLPGAFTDGQKVRISAYNHKSWDGALPVGRGEIVGVINDEAIGKGRFFLDTPDGKATFTTVKHLDELTEWSYAYDVDEHSFGTFGPDDREVQFLRKLTVHELSPVMLGAGIDTRTLSIKAKQMSHDLFARLRDAGLERWGTTTAHVWVEDFDVDANTAIFVICSDTQPTRWVRMAFTRGDNGTVALEGDETDVQPTTTYTPKSRNRKLSEHAASVLTEFDLLVARVDDVAKLRFADGKTLGSDTQTVLERYEVTMKRLRDVLTTEPPRKQDDPLEQIRREAARSQLLLAHANL